MTRARSYRLTPLGVLVLVLLAFWGVALAGLVSTVRADVATNAARPTVALPGSDPAVTWGRSYATNAPGDTLGVPVRWNKACDARGCADQYRVTWTVDYTKGNSVATTPALANVVRDTVLTRTADTAKVVMPPVTQPATVCVYIVAVRRGLASAARNSCRTVESPDAAPPAVDSIKWDSLKVQPPRSALLDSVAPSTGRVAWVPFAFRTVIDTVTRVSRIDSVPIAAGATSDGNASTTLANVPPERTLYFCPFYAHAYEPALVVLVPDTPGTDYTSAQVAQYITRCTTATRALLRGPAVTAPNAIRLVRAPITIESTRIAEPTTRNGV